MRSGWDLLSGVDLALESGPSDPGASIGVGATCDRLGYCLPAAHGLRACLCAKQQYEQAITEGERAIALDPNNADSYAQQAEALN